MKDTILKNKGLFIIIIFLGIVGAIYVSFFIPKISGDGVEYIMQTVAFQNHLSFGITEDDINQAVCEFYC